MTTATARLVISLDQLSGYFTCSDGSFGEVFTSKETAEWKIGKAFMLEKLTETEVQSLITEARASSLPSDGEESDALFEY